MATDLKFQKEQLEKLQKDTDSVYANSSIYTVLFDLVEGNGLIDVVMTLHNLACDLDKREEIEKSFEDSKQWTW